MDSPVAQDGPLSLGGSNRQLEGRVEVVLLLVGAVHHLPTPDHEEARVSQVGCVQLVAPPVQNDDAGRAATCTGGQSFRVGTEMSRGLEHLNNTRLMQSWL